MKSVSLILGSILMVSASAFAGDNGGGYLDCRSASGRTTLRGGAGVQYNGSGHANLTISIDGKELKVGARDLGVQRLADNILLTDAVSFNPRTQVFTLKMVSINSTQEYDFAETFLEVVADPSTMNISNDTATFSATLDTVDPRTYNATEGWNERINNISLKCKLEYGI